ncbi:hypothetical protein RclHR1_12610003 [Rhizophagus clarus]|uniref:snRNA-activating protein complex subunit 4 n=1 Tax=Rhizophagus clarus TaxID=94130 RepID=A0A2Z6QN35_9GLOM|nr:hypothetical protein RclHR1_12610003 [Rhizophagus clarus]GES80495.1 snRNA-activating protein complex subunit 4 [Rhizophagus clarus]
MLTIICFAKTNTRVLSKTAYNLTYGCLKNVSLKKVAITRVALYKSFSSSSDPFGSQSFSPKTEENQLSTITRTQVDGINSSKADPFSGAQEVFSSNTYKSAGHLKLYGDNWENNNNNGVIKQSSYQISKNLEEDYIDLTSYETRSKSFQKGAQKFKMPQNQQLIDAIDEHGENWEYISKEIFNDNFGPEELKYKWDNLKSLIKSRVQQNKVYPFWTTKESLKLTDAVKACGKDWQKISIDWFDNKRSQVSLEKKWEKLAQIENKPYTNFKLIKADNQYRKNWEVMSRNNINPNPLLPERTRLNNSDQSIARELGRELNLQWSNIVNLFGQQAISLEIHFESLQDCSWTKEENSTLFAAIKKYGTDDWEKILKLLPGKSLKNIKERCSNILWEPQEVEAFDKAHEQYGTNWGKISEVVGSRSPGQCWSYWKITTGYDLLKPNSESEVKLETRGIQHANVFIQFPNKELLRMSFIRRNTEEDFIHEKTVC